MPPARILPPLVIVIILALIATFLLARAAFAQSYGVLLARVCANEDSRPLRAFRDRGTAGIPTDDCRAIQQTAFAFGRWQKTTPERALRRLAPHVTGTVPAKKLRHAAYGSLPAEGDARPLPWDEALFGRWDYHKPFWSLFLGYVLRDIAPRDQKQCDCDPISWGDPHGDIALAVARGLKRCSCGNTVNLFWTRPQKVLPAKTAAGSP